MNEREEIIKKYLQDQDYTVIKNGWPDFLVIKNKDGIQEGFGLEIKSEFDKLTEEQKEMHNWLRKLGIPVYVIKSKKEFDSISPVGKTLFSKAHKDKLELELNGIRIQQRTYNDIIVHWIDEYIKLLKNYSIAFQNTENEKYYLSSLDAMKADLKSTLERKKQGE